MNAQTDFDKLVSQGKAYVETICYMTGEPDNCNSCNNYSCCLVNGTGYVDLTRRYYSTETGQFLGEV